MMVPEPGPGAWGIHPNGWNGACALVRLVREGRVNILRMMVDDRCQLATCCGDSILHGDKPIALTPKLWLAAKWEERNDYSICRALSIALVLKHAPAWGYGDRNLASAPNGTQMQID